MSSSTLLQKSMRVADILTLLPEAERLFAQYGLHCSGCSIGGAETLEDAMSMHGMSDDVTNDLLADLHVLLDERPARPQNITVTDAAAHALSEIMKAEEKSGWVLAVTLDHAGGFCMEFNEKMNNGDRCFSNSETSDVRVSASDLTLKTIGGSTIDFREGRFKLDLPAGQAGLPGAAAACGCKDGGACGCG